MSLPQAKAAPASPCDRSQRRHARGPLSDELAGDHSLFEAATSASRRLDPSSDPDLDPGAALLLRVEPTRAARPSRGVGEGPGAGARGRKERLLALRAAALAVGSDSHLNFSKNPAPDSRPPGQRSQRATTAPSAPTALVGTDGLRERRSAALSAARPLISSTDQDTSPRGRGNPQLNPRGV